jgi:hypothetical protein
MAKDFIPQREGDLQQWMGNIQLKIGGYAATFGLTPADVTAISDACTRTFTNINNVEIERQTFQQIVEKKDMEKEEDIALLRKFFNQIKAHNAFTSDIGKDLDIVSEKQPKDAGNAKPKLKLKLVPQGVRVDFTKEKVFDAVNVYSRNKGTTQWIKLAMDTSSPYIDTRELTNEAVPETREYMDIGVINDEEVGQPSDIVSMVYGG